MLLSTPDEVHATNSLAADLEAHPHLPTGLLLLDLDYLRTFAHSSFFPLYTVSSGLTPGGHKRERRVARDEFLEDVRDLEDFGLGWESKRRIVERMWRCWAGALGLQMVG